MVIRKTFGARLRDLRRSRGMTQSQVGRLYGVKKSKISLLESGAHEAPSDAEEVLSTIAAYPVRETKAKKLIRSNKPAKKIRKGCELVGILRDGVVCATALRRDFDLSELIKVMRWHDREISKACKLPDEENNG